MARRHRDGSWKGEFSPHTEYQTRPLEWIVKYLGVPENTIRWSLNEHYPDHKWDGDKDPFIQVLEGIAAGRDVGVESATGTGKTFLLACIVYWFIACFEDSLVITVAPTEDQLLTRLWKEIGRLFPRFERHFPQAQYLPSGKLRMKPAVSGKEVWAADAFICGVGADEVAATRAAGLHAEHMLIITEETPGIHPAIMNALHETRTDDHNLHLAVGNPDYRGDPLNEFCNLETVLNVRASALDHPNIVSGKRIIPGAIGKRRLADRTARLGKGSRLYLSRIQGICPSESADALIRWEWCKAAAAKWSDPSYREGVEGLGADVASVPTGDAAAIARGKGACLINVRAFQVMEGPSSVGVEIAHLVKSRKIDPRHVGVDGVGVGAAAIDASRALGVKVRNLNGGYKAVPELDEDLRWSETSVDIEGRIIAMGPKVLESERYGLLRDQMYYRMREDLMMGNIALPDDEELFQDLTTPTWKTEGGKIKVETKESVIKRLRRSTNKGDAAVYWNFVRRRSPVSQTAVESRLDEPNRDIGLEKLLANLGRQRVAKERQMDKVFNAAVKARRRARLTKRRVY